MNGDASGETAMAAASEYRLMRCQSQRGISTPPVAIRPVASSGVSAAYWLAAMLSPAFQPDVSRPARNYSCWLREAFRLARKPAVMAQTTKSRMSARSIMPSPARAAKARGAGRPG